MEEGRVKSGCVTKGCPIDVNRACCASKQPKGIGIGLVKGDPGERSTRVIGHSWNGNLKEAGKIRYLTYAPLIPFFSLLFLLFAFLYNAKASILSSIPSMMVVALFF